MTIYLVRHGITEWNIKKQIQGRTDIPLHEEGRRQAEALAGKLKKADKYSLIFASPLLRAYETARILSKRLHVPVVTNPLLQEIAFGKWDGKQPARLQGKDRTMFETWRKNPTQASPPGGETIFNVQQRLQTFLENNDLESYPRPIIVVCHQIVGAALTCTLRGEDLSEMPQYYMKNTDYRVLSPEAFYRTS